MRPRPTRSTALVIAPALLLVLLPRALLAQGGDGGDSTDLATEGLLQTATPRPTKAAKEFHPHSGGVVFLGGTTETKRGKDKVESGFAAGYELSYRFAPLWSVSFTLEAVGTTSVVRDLMLVAMAGIWPWEGLRFVAGPGIEFAESKEEFVFRFGTGYKFKLGKAFVVAPEVFVDWIGLDKITYVYGGAFGVSVTLD